VILDFGNLPVGAIALATLIAFGLGALWYTVLFGKAWVRLQGFTPEDLQRLQRARPPHVFFGGMLACYAVITVAFAMLARATGVRSAAAGAQLGFVLWLVAAGIGVTGWLAAGRRFGVTAIDLGFQLTFLLAQGAALGAASADGAP
jgi:hypothetical protein